MSQVIQCLAVIHVIHAPSRTHCRWRDSEVRNEYRTVRCPHCHLCDINIFTFFTSCQAYIHLTARIYFLFNETSIKLTFIIFNDYRNVYRPWHYFSEFEVQCWKNCRIIVWHLADDRCYDARHLIITLNNSEVGILDPEFLNQFWVFYKYLNTYL